MSLKEAIIEDLYRVPENGKAEIVNGQLVLMDAEEKMATKCQDYFAAGTLAVWDVNVLQAEVVICRANNLQQPQVYRRGELADAEPAVSGVA